MDCYANLFRLGSFGIPPLLHNSLRPVKSISVITTELQSVSIHTSTSPHTSTHTRVARNGFGSQYLRIGSFERGGSVSLCFLDTVSVRFARLIVILDVRADGTRRLLCDS